MLEEPTLSRLAGCIRHRRSARNSIIYRYIRIYSSKLAGVMISSWILAAEGGLGRLSRCLTTHDHADRARAGPGGRANPHLTRFPRSTWISPGPSMVHRSTWPARATFSNTPPLPGIRGPDRAGAPASRTIRMPRAELGPSGDCWRLVGHRVKQT